MMKKEEGSNDSGKINETIAISTQILSKLPDYPDIMFKILTFLTPRDLYRFKCVSKSICRLIEEPIFTLEHFKRLKATSPLNNVFYQFLKIPYEWDKPALISMYGIDSKLLLPDPTLDYLRVNKNGETAVMLLGFCDGLILCAELCYTTDEYTTYVHNPLTMEKVCLNRLDSDAFSRFDQSLFAQCCSSTGCIRYKVVCLYESECLEDQTKFSELFVFSSDTGMWDKMEEKLPPMVDKNELDTLVMKDVMYWDCFEDCILVFYFKKSKSGRWFDLIQTPKAEVTRSLWDYDGKLHCYCHGYEQEGEYFTSWVLSFNDNKFEWKKENSKIFKNLAEDVRNECQKSGRIVAEAQSRVPLDMKFIMYEPNSKTIYLFILDEIFSYEFEKRKLERKIQFPDAKDIEFFGIILNIQCMMPMEIAGSHKSSSAVPGIDNECGFLQFI